MLVWGNRKNIWLCPSYQAAWRLKGFRNKSSLNALSDICTQNLVENYKAEGCRILGIHLRNQDHGAKIIQRQNLLVKWAMNWWCSCVGRGPGGWFLGSTRCCSFTPKDPRFVSRHIYSGRHFAWAPLLLEQRKGTKCEFVLFYFFIIIIFWICFNGSLFTGICPHPQLTPTLHAMVSGYKGCWQKAQMQKWRCDGKKPAVKEARQFRVQAATSHSRR